MRKDSSVLYYLLCIMSHVIEMFPFGFPCLPRYIVRFLETTKKAIAMVYIREKLGTGQGLKRRVWIQIHVGDRIFTTTLAARRRPAFQKFGRHGKLKGNTEKTQDVICINAITSNKNNCCCFPLMALVLLASPNMSILESYDNIFNIFV